MVIIFYHESILLHVHGDFTAIFYLFLFFYLFFIYFFDSTPKINILHIKQYNINFKNIILLKHTKCAL